LTVISERFQGSQQLDRLSKYVPWKLTGISWGFARKPARGLDQQIRTMKVDRYLLEVFKETSERIGAANTMEVDWYLLEVFKETSKRIGPHTDHYNCIFMQIVRRSPLHRLKKRKNEGNTEIIASVKQLPVVHILGTKRKEYYKNSRGRRVWKLEFHTWV